MPNGLWILSAHTHTRFTYPTYTSLSPPIHSIQPAARISHTTTKAPPSPPTTKVSSRIASLSYPGWWTESAVIVRLIPSPGMQLGSSRGQSGHTRKLQPLSARCPDSPSLIGRTVLSLIVPYCPLPTAPNVCLNGRAYSVSFCHVLQYVPPYWMLVEMTVYLLP